METEFPPPTCAPIRDDELLLMRGAVRRRWLWGSDGVDAGSYAAGSRSGWRRDEQFASAVLYECRCLAVAEAGFAEFAKRVVACEHEQDGAVDAHPLHCEVDSDQGLEHHDQSGLDRFDQQRPLFGSPRLGSVRSACGPLRSSPATAERHQRSST